MSDTPYTRETYYQRLIVKTCKDCKNVDGTPHDKDCPTGALEAVVDRLVNVMGLVVDPTEAERLIREELLTFRASETARFLKLAGTAIERGASKGAEVSARSMFERTRRRVCHAMGVDEGHSWSWIESELASRTLSATPLPDGEGDPDSDEPYDVIRWHLINAPGEDIVLTPELARRAIVRFAAGNVAQQQLDGAFVGPLDDECAPSGQARTVNVIFDGPPAHESGRFVEVESLDGSSFRAGKWIDRRDGTWALQITALAPDDPGEQGEEPPVACGALNEDVERLVRMAEQDEAAEDVVDNPSHYGGRDNPYETIKVMLAWYGKRTTAAFCHLNAVKYLSRFAKKGEAEDRGVDLRKAAWYAKTAALIIEEGKVRP